MAPLAPRFLRPYSVGNGLIFSPKVLIIAAYSGPSTVYLSLEPILVYEIHCNSGGDLIKRISCNFLTKQKYFQCLCRLLKNDAPILCILQTIANRICKYLCHSREIHHNHNMPLHGNLRNQLPGTLRSCHNQGSWFSCIKKVEKRF